MISDSTIEKKGAWVGSALTAKTKELNSEISSLEDVALEGKVKEIIMGTPLSKRDRHYFLSSLEYRVNELKGYYNGNGHK